MPEIERSVVDLPAPLEPISVTISPCVDLERDALERLDRAVEGVDVLDAQDGSSPSSRGRGDLLGARHAWLPR